METQAQRALYFRNKGNDYYTLKDFDKALHCYRMGISCNEVDTLLYSNMSQTHLALKMYVEAEDDAKKAIELDKDNAKAYFRAAKAAAGLGNETKAIKYLRNGLKRNSLVPNSELSNYLAELLLEVNQSKQSATNTHVDGEASTLNTPTVASEIKVNAGLTAPATSGKSKEKIGPTETKPNGKVKGKTGPIESKDIAEDKFLQTVEASMKSVSLFQAPTQVQKRRMVLEFFATSKDGSELLFKGLLKTAATKYKVALDILVEYPPECLDLGRMEEVILKYAISWCWMQSKDNQSMVKAIEHLNAIREQYSVQLPAVHYALGNFFFKINRFHLALKNLEKGLSIIKKKHPFDAYCWPGTKHTIKETTSDGLQESMLEMLPGCKQFHPPDAICKHNKETCFEISNQIVPSELIFFSDPDYVGFVVIICQMKCKIQYHLACWKDLKESHSVISGEKVSDKDMLGWPCPTDDCVTSTKDRSVVVAIQIIGENGVIKSQSEREPPVKVKTDTADSVAKDAKKLKKKTEKAKSTSTTTTTVEKEKPKLKPRLVPAEKKAASSGPKVQNPVKPIVTKPQATMDCYQNDLDDEFAFEDLESSAADSDEILIQKMHAKQLEGVTCYKQAIGQPMEAFYGRDDLVKDLWFMTKSANACQDFIFSFFYDFLNEEGPQPISEIEERWDAEKRDCEQYQDLAKRDDFPGIINYLSESFHFVIVNDYIGTCENAPEVFECSTTDIADCFEFLLKGYPPLNPADSESNSEKPRSAAISAVTKLHLEPKLPDSITSRFPTTLKLVDGNSSKVVQTSVVGGIKTEIGSPKKVKDSGKQRQKCDEKEKQVNEPKKSRETSGGDSATVLGTSNISAEAKPSTEKNKKPSKSSNPEVIPSSEKNKNPSKSLTQDIVPSLEKNKKPPKSLNQEVVSSPKKNKKPPKSLNLEVVPSPEKIKKPSRKLNLEVASSSASIEPSSKHQGPSLSSVKQKHSSQASSKQSEANLKEISDDVILGLENTSAEKPPDLIQHSVTMDHSKKTSLLLTTTPLDKLKEEVKVNVSDNSTEKKLKLIKPIPLSHEEHTQADKVLVKTEIPSNIHTVYKISRPNDISLLTTTLSDCYDFLNNIMEDGVSAASSSDSEHSYTSYDSAGGTHLRASRTKVRGTADKTTDHNGEADLDAAIKDDCKPKEVPLSDIKLSVQASDFQPRQSVFGSSDININLPPPTLISNPFWEDKSILNCPVMFQDSLLDTEIPSVASNIHIKKEIDNGIMFSEEGFLPIPSVSVKLEPIESPQTSCKPVSGSEDEFDEVLSRGTDLLNQMKDRLDQGELQQEASHITPTLPAPTVEMMSDSKNCQTELTNTDIEELIQEWENANGMRTSIALQKPVVETADHICQTELTCDALDKMSYKLEGIQEENKALSARMKSADEVTLILLDVRKKVDADNHKLREENKKMATLKDEFKVETTKSLKVNRDLVDMNNTLRTEKVALEGQLGEAKQISGQLQQKIEYFKEKHFKSLQEIVNLKLLYLKLVTEFAEVKVSECDEKYSMMILKLQDARKTPNVDSEKLGRLTELQNQLKKDHQKVSDLNNEVMRQYEALKHNVEHADLEHLPKVKCAEIGNEYHAAICDIEPPEKQDGKPCCAHRCGDEKVPSANTLSEVKADQEDIVVHVCMPTPPHFVPEDGVKYVFHRRLANAQSPQPNFAIPNGAEAMSRPQHRPSIPFQGPHLRQNMYMGNISNPNFPYHQSQNMFPLQIPQFRQGLPQPMNFPIMHNPQNHAMKMNMLNIPNRHQMNVPPHNVYSGQPIYNNFHSPPDIKNPNLINDIFGEKSAGLPSLGLPSTGLPSASLPSVGVQTNPEVQRAERAGASQSQDGAMQNGDRSRSNSFGDLASGLHKHTERVSKSTHSLPKLQNVVPIDKDVKDLTRVVEELKKRHPLNSMAELQKCLEVVLDRDDTYPRLPFAKINALVTTELETRAKSRKNAWGSVKPDVTSWKPEKVEEDCAICMEKMVNTKMHTLDCQHTFHQTCIKLWLGRNSVCPMCNRHSKMSDEYPPLK